MTASPASLIDSSGMLRGVLRLALPVLVEQLLLMLVGFSDTLLTGWYFDAPHLAAINLMVYVFWMLNSLFVFVAIGATAMVARFVGAQDRKMAARVTNQAVLIGTAMALVVLLVGLAAGGPLVQAMQLRGEAAELAVRYFYIVLLAAPFIMLEVVGVACLRGAGDMVSGLVAMAIVNLVNVAVSWSLVLGLGPLPEVGWDGLAIGTLCGNVIGGLIVVRLLVAGRAGLWLSWRRLVPDVDLIRRLLRIGVPGGADSLSVVGCQLWFVALINRLGDLAAAAHGVAIRIESLAYLPGIAFQVAAATLAGQFLGARDERRATRSVLATLAACNGLMLVAAVIFFTAAEPLARVFLGRQETEIIQLSAGLLRIVAFGMPALAVTMVFTGALRGAGDTRWPLAITWIGYLGVRIPGTYLVSGYLGYGVRGAWYMMIADLMLRAVLITYRFWHGGWRRVEV